jgi:hypothetical protein
MCCVITTFFFLGPRAGILVWWLVDQVRWEAAFSSFFWPLLGFIFAPWTTLMYVLVAPTGDVAGFDWIWLAIAVLADLSMYMGGGYANRGRVRG